jgi:ABC-three component (ABC-3C) system Middle Component 3
MLAWKDRPKEEANLFNPAFCGALICEFVAEFHKARRAYPSFALIFCALPIALYPKLRQELPSSVRTSLYSWIEEHAENLVGYSERARNFVPYAQEALRFTLDHAALEFVDGANLKPAQNKALFGRQLEQSTSEIRDIVLATRLLGRWFAAAGAPATVLSAWGIKP